MAVKLVTFLSVFALFSILGIAADSATSWCANLQEGVAIFNKLDRLTSNVWLASSVSPRTTNKCISYIFSYNATSNTLNILVTQKSGSSSKMEGMLLNATVKSTDAGFKPYTVFYPSGESWIYQFLDVSHSTVSICGYSPSNFTNSFGLILTRPELTSLPPPEPGWYNVDQSCYNSASKAFIMSLQWIFWIYGLLIMFSKFM